MLLLTLVLFWTVPLCVPMPIRNRSAAVTRGHRDQDMFKGIDWSLAKENCNDAQLTILEQATFVAVTEMLNPGSDGVDVLNDPMWTWFFKPYPLLSTLGYQSSQCKDRT
ncbi:hypothetical protein PV05_03080 [Exophiala xenobiotica]|uniref:C-type lectin domain-containing protein n=1 Tax=Exophiala xenobiotica TaxID=348802 RepID=A0A0D2D8G5_9EURO|nr:uncharacterized protein PV05_03080 [Exophiala xenobiotica]KIW58572.1 hypothetical protein PV05_03080 [Exophiala xenobiotica]